MSVLFIAAGVVISAVGVMNIRGSILHCLSGKGATVTIRGKAVSDPGGEQHSSVFAEVYSVESGSSSWKTREKVLICIEGDTPGALHRGSLVEASGRLSKPEGNGKWLEDRGAAAIIRCARGAFQIRGSTLIDSCIHNFRNWARRSFDRLYPDDVSGFIAAVTLGDRSSLNHMNSIDLDRCGISHLTAVSGLHVASAVMVATAFTALLGSSRRTRIGCGLLCVVFVAGMAGFRPSSLRASIMASICMLGYFTGRKHQALSALCLAGVVMLIFNNRALLDAGFQFSFLACGGILLSTSGDPNRKGRFHRLAAACAGAQFGIIPLLLLRGEHVPVTAIAANLVSVPLMGPLIALGWLSCVLAAAGTVVAGIASIPASLIAKWITSCASYLASIPVVHPSADILSSLCLASYTTGLLFILRGTRRRSGFLIPVIALVIACLFAMMPVSIGRIASGGSRVVFLDVGQGDAIVASDGDGNVVMVDGGPDSGSVVEKLRCRGIDRIDLMVLSHPHADHAEGLVSVTKSMPVGLFLDPGLPNDSTRSYSMLLEALRDRGVETAQAREGQRIELSGRLSMEVLYTVSEAPQFHRDLNNASVVIMLCLDDVSILLCGDIECDGQEELIGLHPDLRCQVLKIPHQGALDAVNEDLIDACNPGLAVISVGANNPHGHPSARCLEELESRGIEVYRTDMSGDVEVAVSGDRIGVVRNGR